MRLKTMFLITFVLFLILAIVSGSRTVLAKTAPEKNAYIVVLKDSEKDPQGTAKKMGNDYGLKTKHIYTRVLKGFSAAIAPDKLSKVRTDKRVKYVAEDKVVQMDAKKVKPNPTAIPSGTPAPSITPAPTKTPNPTNVPLSIRILTPNGGEVLERGQVYRITWESSPQIDTVTIGYKACESCLDWIAFTAPNTGFYDWTVNVGNTTNTQFKIDITGYDTGVGSVNDLSDNSFTVLQPTPTPPIWLKVKTPNGGEVLNTGESYTITWDADPRIDKVTIGYKACESCLDWIAFTAPNTGSYVWNVATAYASSQYLIDITGYWTGYGSVTDRSDAYFTVIKPNITPKPTSTPNPTPTPAGQIVPLGLQRMGIVSGGAQSMGGGGNTVAVLDTGVDLAHPDIGGAVLVAVNCLSGTCTTGGMDDNGHGTHVAGTIAALDNTFGVVGVVPSSRIVSVKVLDSSGWGYWSQIIAGIDWVTAHASEYNIRVANMSLGGDGASDNNCGNSNNDPLHQALCASTGAGVTYVVSAGNETVDTATKVPAGYDDTVITVSALVDTDGKPGGLGTGTTYGNDDTFASFSNYGSAVDLGASGVRVYSTIPGGAYGYYNGTSMASPHVAGAAVRYINSHPGSTRVQVLDGLKTIAEPLNGGHTDPSGRHPEPVVLVNGL